MAAKYDPNNPDPARQALLDQLGPDDPANDPAVQQPTLSVQSGAIPREPTQRLPDDTPSPAPDIGRAEPAPPPAPPATSPVINRVTPGPPPPSTAPRSGDLPVPGVDTNPNIVVQPAPTTPTAPTYGGNPNDPAWIQSWLSYYAGQAGINPSVGGDPAYWQRRILQTGGLSPANTQYWIGLMQRPEGAPEGGGGPAGGPMPAPPPQFSGTNLMNYNIAVDPTTALYNQQMRDFMTSQLGILSQPTNETSPDIAPALSAYNNESQRGQEQNDDALAEAYYAQGGGGGAGLQSGAFRTAQQQGREATAGSRANFAGQTILTASQQKRQQLQEMLQTATSMGMTQQAQDIQRQIASIDANLRDKGLNNQNSQFGDQLGFNYANLIAQMNRDNLLAGLNG